MPKRRLTKGSLLNAETANIVKELMSSPHDEKFVSTILYQKRTLNMYLEAYRFNHAISDDENLPEHLKELVKIYQLFDICIKRLPEELKQVYECLFENKYSMSKASNKLLASKTSVFRYKNLIIKSLVSCLNM